MTFSPEHEAALRLVLLAEIRRVMGVSRSHSLGFSLYRAAGGTLLWCAILYLMVPIATFTNLIAGILEKDGKMHKALPGRNSPLAEDRFLFPGKRCR